MIVYTFGTCITFLIIIGDQFDRLLASLYGHTFCHHWYMNRDFTMTASCILLILPFCYSKKIDFLRVPSAVGVIAIFYIIALIIYEKFYSICIKYIHIYFFRAFNIDIQLSETYCLT